MFFKKSSIAVLCTVVNFSIFADQGLSESTNANMESGNIERGYPLPKSSLPAGYNSFGRIDTRDSFGVFVKGSFLYLTPKEKGLDVAQFRPTDPNSATGKIIRLEGEYKCGFDAGIGLNFDYDHWIIDVNYTRFHCSEHKSTSKPDNGFLSPSWLIQQNNDATHASAKWRLAIDLLDLHLSRAYYQGTHLIFHPFCGLRGGWLDQRYHAKYTIDSPIASKHKSNSWLIGPQVGTEAKWLLDAGFRFFGKGALALFYQRFSLHMEEMSINNPSSVENNVGGRHNCIQPNAEITLGLGWGTYFCNSGYHVDLSAGYTFQIFWNQNMMRALKDSYNSNIDGNADDLMLHGLVASLRFDF